MTHKVGICCIPFTQLSQNAKFSSVFKFMPLSILHMLHSVFKFCSPKCLNLPYHKWEKRYSYYSWHWILAQSISNNVVWKACHPLVPSATTFPKLFWILHTLQWNSIHNHWEAALVIGNKCLASQAQFFDVRNFANWQKIYF